MKRAVLLILAALMLLGAAGCGDSQPKMPAFSQEEMTEAQQYASAAIGQYKIKKTLGLLSADVLLTDDIYNAISGVKMDPEVMDSLKGTKAVVLARYLPASQLAKDDEEEEKDKKDDEEPEVQPEPTFIEAFFMNENKEVIKEFWVYGSNGGDAAAAAPMESGGGGGSATQDKRRQLAMDELDAEAYLEQNAEDENLAAFAKLVQAAPQTAADLGAPHIIPLGHLHRIV